MTEKRYFIYGRGDCPFCTMACDYLVAHQLPYIFFDHKEDKDFLSDIKEFYTSETVPIILENDLGTGLVTKVGGYKDLLGHFNDRV